MKSAITAVVLVLRDKNMILFTKRTKPEDHLKNWIPLSAGGHIEIGETSEEAIIREAKEELGVNVEITRFLGQIKHKDFLLVFEGKPLSKKLKPDPKEIQEVKWVPIQQVKEFSSNVLTKKVLDLFYKMKDVPA